MDKPHLPKVAMLGLVAIVLLSCSVGGPDPVKHFKSIVANREYRADDFKIQVVKKDSQGAAVLWQAPDAKDPDRDWHLYLFISDENTEYGYNSFYGIRNFDCKPSQQELNSILTREYSQ